MNWKQDVIRKKNYYILIGISVIFLIVSLIAGIWYYYKINKDNEINVLKYNESIVNLMQGRIDSELSEVHYIDYYIEINETVQKKLKGSELDNQDKINIMNQLYRLKESMKLLEDICIYLEDEDIVISSRNITTPKIYFETQCNMAGYTYESWENDYLLRPRNKEFYPEQTIKLSDIFNQKVIMYKRTLFSSLSEQSKVHILMMIRTDRIEKLTEDISNNIGSSIVISDTEGNEVYKNDRNILDVDIEQIYYDNGKLLPYDEDYVVHKKSDNLNLIYSIRLSKKSIMHDINSFMYIGILLIILYLILVIGYLYLSIRLSYKPLKVIMKKISRNDNESNGEGSEIEFITTKIDELINKEDAYASHIERFDRYKKNSMLKDLLLGNNSSDTEYGWEYDFFAVSLIRVMEIRDFDDESEMQLVKYGIFNMLKELTANIARCEIIEMNKNDIVIIFNFNEKQYGDIINGIQDVANIISEIIENQMNTTIITAISGMHNDIKKISQCYKEAMAAINFRSINDEDDNGVIVYDRINNAESQKNEWYYWPSNLSEMLLGYIERGDYDSIDKLIDDTVKVSIRNPRNIDILGECLYYNISGVLVDVSAKYISTYSMIAVPQYNSRMNFKENINVLKKRFRELCDIVSSNNKSELKLLQRIEEYIDAHYIENDLSVTKIAEHMNVSTSYMQAYFKKHKNTTLTKYITQKRVAYAKQLLKDTDSTISVIAIKVGFTDACMFGKIFKKNEGVTPGQYREISRNQ